MLAAAEPGSARPPRIPPSRSAWSMGAAARDGRDKLTLVVPPALEPFGLWVEQLIAESTGKNGTGHRPDRRRAARRAGRRTAPIVCSCACDCTASLGEDDARRGDRARRGDAGARSSRSTCRSRRRSAPSSCAGKSRRRSPARSSRSTRSTSRTCSRRRTRPTRCSHEYKATGRLPIAAAGSTLPDGIALTLTTAARDGAARPPAPTRC